MIWVVAAMFMAMLCLYTCEVWRHASTRKELERWATGDYGRYGEPGAPVTSLESDQSVFDSFYWDGILIDERHRDALYAKFLTLYEVDATDATRYEMACALADEQPNSKAVNIIAPRDPEREMHVWPDGSTTCGFP